MDIIVAMIGNTWGNGLYIINGYCETNREARCSSTDCQKLSELLQDISVTYK